MGVALTRFSRTIGEAIEARTQFEIEPQDQDVAQMIALMDAATNKMEVVNAWRFMDQTLGDPTCSDQLIDAKPLVIPIAITDTEYKVFCVQFLEKVIARNGFEPERFVVYSEEEIDGVPSFCIKLNSIFFAEVADRERIPSQAEKVRSGNYGAQPRL